MKLVIPDGEPPFHKVVAIRQPNGWIVRLSGQRLDAVSVQAPIPRRVVLVVRDGTTHFEGIQIVRLMLAEGNFPGSGG